MPPTLAHPRVLARRCGPRSLRAASRPRKRETHDWRPRRSPSCHRPKESPSECAGVAVGAREPQLDGIGELARLGREGTGKRPPARWARKRKESGPNLNGSWQQGHSAAYDTRFRPSRQHGVSKPSARPSHMSPESHGVAKSPA